MVYTALAGAFRWHRNFGYCTHQNICRLCGVGLSLWGSAKQNPQGRLAFLPLFMEQSAAICVSLSMNIVLAHAEVTLRESYLSLLVYGATFCLPIVFVVHMMRHSYREKAKLIFDLNNFEVDKLTCASDFDRAFILSAIDGWYGSREAFRDFVRSDLREELLSLLPCPHLPCVYAALILSSTTARLIDSTLSLYNAGADGQDLLRDAMCFYPFF